MIEAVEKLKMILSKTKKIHELAISLNLRIINRRDAESREFIADLCRCIYKVHCVNLFEAKTLRLCYLQGEGLVLKI